MVNDFLNRVTFGITAFNRPGHLRALVRSILDQYPWNFPRIHIVDNGDQTPEELEVEFHETPGVTYTRLPFDVGLSACRNVLADSLETEFLLLLEDDFEFTEQTRIEDLVRVLEANRLLGLVGGQVRSHLRESFPGFLRDGRVQRLPEEPVKRFAGDVPYQVCEFVSNFALIRRDMLRVHRWDERLKLAEHFEFFDRVRRDDQWQVAFCDSVEIRHNRDGRDARYREFRGRAQQFVPLAVELRRRRDEMFDTPEKRALARQAAVDFAHWFPGTWLGCGTLLGAIRDRDVIPHDSDVDFICPTWPVQPLESVSSPDGPRCGPFTLRKTLHHQDRMSELVYRHDNGIKVDLFRVLDIFSVRQVVAYGDEFQGVETVIKEYPPELFKSPATLRIWDTVFLCPEPEPYLELTYGPGWRVPDPEWTPWGKL